MRIENIFLCTFCVAGSYWLANFLAQDCDFYTYSRTGGRIAPYDCIRGSMNLLLGEYLFDVIFLIVVFTIEIFG
jgi:hypothetical protein